MITEKCVHLLCATYLCLPYEFVLLHIRENFGKIHFQRDAALAH